MATRDDLHPQAKPQDHLTKSEGDLTQGRDAPSPAAGQGQAAGGRGETAVKRASYRAGFMFGSLSFLSVTVIGVASMIITSRLYGIRVVGQYALVWAPVGALALLSTIKEQQALIKEITGLPPRHPRVTQLFAAVFSFSFGLTIGVAALDAVACWFVFRGPLHAPDLLAPVFVQMAGYVFVMNTGWNIDSIFSAFVAGRQLFWVRLHEVISYLTIAIVIGLTWRSVWGLVIATIGGWLTSLIHRMIAVRPFVRTRLNLREYRLGLQVLPELLRFGLKATPGQLAQGVSQQGGVWAIGIVAPVATVGAYSRAQLIPQRVQQSSMRITEVLYPTLVGRHTQGDKHGFDRALIDSIRYETVGMLLLAAVLGGAAHSVLEIFGPGFSQATTALALLALFPAMASITVTQTQALWATDRPALTSVIAMVRMAITVALLVILTPKLGVTGPAVALLVGYLAVIVLSGYALRSSLARPLHATWPRRQRLVLLIAYGCGFGAAHATELAAPSTIGLLLALIAGTLAFVVAFFLGGGVNHRDRRRLSDALGMAHSWRERRRASRQADVALE
jgi:O-antigen/teichoic acid export membrane protein